MNTFHWDPALSLVFKRLLSSLIDVYLRILDVYPKINSMAGYYYDYRSGGSCMHPLPSDLASQYHFPAHGQPQVPTGGPPREPHPVGFPSSWA